MRLLFLSFFVFFSAQAYSHTKWDYVSSPWESYWEEDCGTGTVKVTSTGVVTTNNCGRIKTGHASKKLLNEMKSLMKTAMKGYHKKYVCLDYEIADYNFAIYVKSGKDSVRKLYDDRNFICFRGPNEEIFHFVENVMQEMASKL